MPCLGSVTCMKQSRDKESRTLPFCAHPGQSRRTISLSSTPSSSKDGSASGSCNSCGVGCTNGSTTAVVVGGASAVTASATRATVQSNLLLR